MNIEDAKAPLGLTVPERIFCEAYTTLGPLANATKAAAKAGYKNPGAQASILLARPRVQEYIAQIRKRAAMRNNITLDDIINELARIAFADFRELYDEFGQLKPIQQLDAHVAATIKDIEFEENLLAEGGRSLKRISRLDKLAALSQLRECLGFKDREIKVKRDATGKVIETEETVSPSESKVIFEDNSKRE